MLSVPVMLAVMVLFAPALLALLLFAAALEGHLLKRPEEAAARDRETPRQQTATAAAEPAQAPTPETAPAPIPAYLPSQPPATSAPAQSERFEAVARPAET